MPRWFYGYLVLYLYIGIVLDYFLLSLDAREAFVNKVPKVLIGKQHHVLFHLQMHTIFMQCMAL